MIMAAGHLNKGHKENALLSKNNNHKVIASEWSSYKQWEAQEITYWNSKEGHNMWEELMKGKTCRFQVQVAINSQT